MTVIKIKGLNETTRRYPNTLEDAFPDTVEAIEARQRWEWMEGSRSDTAAQAEYWTHMTLAFACGFLVCYLFV